MIEIIPFGSVLEDRFNTSKEYNLVEMCAGIWRLSEKARSNYEPISFMRFLQGRIDKPSRIKKQEQESITHKQPKEQIVDELLSL